MGRRKKESKVAEKSAIEKNDEFIASVFPIADAMPRRKFRANRRAKWKKPEPPTALQLAYYDALMTYTRRVAAEFKAVIFPVVEKLVAPAALDAEGSPLDKALSLFLKRVTALSREKIDKAARKMVDGVETFERKLFVSNIKNSVGVDVSAIVSPKQVAAEIDGAIKANFDLIKSIGPNYSERGRAIIENGLRTGRSQIDLQKDLLNLGGFTDQYKGTEQRRAKLIARDQSQKFAKALDITRQKKIGAKRFEWVNVGDERVRDDHNDYGGNIYSYDDPPNGEMPGDEVNCRCHPRPVIEDILAALENGDIS